MTISVNSFSTFRAEPQRGEPRRWIVVETLPQGTVSERSDRDRAILANLTPRAAADIAAVLNRERGER